MKTKRHDMYSNYKEYHLYLVHTDRRSKINPDGITRVYAKSTNMARKIIENNGLTVYAVIKPTTK